MRCAQAREALSSWYDGESADADPAAVAGHVAGCGGCTAFQRALGAIADLASHAAGDLAATLLPGRPGLLARPRVRLGLRLAVAVAGLAALVPAVAEAWGRADHEVHESLAFTVAVAVAMLGAAARPHLVRAYLPVLAAPSLLLVLTTAVDVDGGRVALGHELRHLGVLSGFLLVALLAAGEPPERPRRRRSRRRSRPPRSTVVRLITRSALPATTGAFLVGLLLLVGPPASAHAMLESSTPAADSIVSTPPTSVDLLFNEAVTLLPGSVRVYGPDGSRVDDGTVAHISGDAATAGTGLRGGLLAGTYLVSYRVVSADSHPIEGAYTFAIGHFSRASAALPGGDDGSRGVAVGLGVARWLSYAGSALGLGGFAFLVWCWPSGWASRRARLLVAGGVGALVAGTLLGLLLKGPYDAGSGLGRVTDGDLLREVLATTYGEALDARLLLLAALVLVLTYREQIPARVLATAPAVLLAGVGMTFALCGHAAAGSHRPLAVLSDTVHVAAMSAWLGGLMLLLGAALVRGRDDVTPAVLRFSTLATGAVTVLIATGTYQTLREVRSWDVLLHTHYGHVLVVKLGIVGLAFLAAAGSRAWVWQSANPVVPVHAATSAPPGPVLDGRPRLGRLRLSVGLESLLLVGVLVVTAMLVTSDPARSSGTPDPVITTVTVGPDRVRVSAVPDGARRVDLSLDVTDAAGHPVEPREIHASLTLTSEQIGPLPITLSASGRGHRTGRVSVPVPGAWRLAVTVRTSAIDEATGYVDVRIE